MRARLTGFAVCEVAAALLSTAPAPAGPPAIVFPSSSAGVKATTSTRIGAFGVRSFSIARRPVVATARPRASHPSEV